MTGCPCALACLARLQATSVRLQLTANAGEHATLGQLLRQIERQSRKTCDTDDGGLGWGRVGKLWCIS